MIISLILLCIVALFLWFKTKKEPTSTNTTIVNTQNNKQPNTNTLHHNKTDIKEIPLDEIIMNKSTVMEPEASNVWGWIQDIGLYHENSVIVLDGLFSTHGNRKYYKELIGFLKIEDIPDKVRAKIIYLLAAAYEGGSTRTNKRLYEPINKKDREIQNALRQEIDNPHGEDSLDEILGYVYLVADDTETQNILDNFLIKKSKFISKNEIYKLKLKSSRYADSYESSLTVLNELNQMTKKEQKELTQTLSNPDFAESLAYFKNEELSNLYLNLLKKNPPSTPYKFDDSTFEKNLKGRFEGNFPLDVETDEDKFEYVLKNHKDEMETMYKDNEQASDDSRDQYAKWIQAQAYMVPEEQRYDFYKKTLLNAKTSTERRAIITRLSIQADMEYNEESEGHMRRFNQDEDLQNIMKESK